MNLRTAYINIDGKGAVRVNVINVSFWYWNEKQKCTYIEMNNGWTLKTSESIETIDEKFGRKF